LVVITDILALVAKRFCVVYQAQVELVDLRTAGVTRVVEIQVALAWLELDIIAHKYIQKVIFVV
jgi:hypothetical protein